MPASAEQRRRRLERVTDMTVAELVALAQRDAEVTRLSAEHRKYAAEIQNAIEVLARKQETRFETMVPAVLKAADAIVNGVRVFISYKMAQPKQAETLREILMKRGFAGVLHDPELGFPFLAAR